MSGPGICPCLPRRKRNIRNLRNHCLRHRSAAARLVTLVTLVTLSRTQREPIFCGRCPMIYGRGSGSLKS
jgi:hypothetical protein